MKSYSEKYLKFLGKHLHPSPFSVKLQAIEIFQSTYSVDHLWTTASVLSYKKETSEAVKPSATSNRTVKTSASLLKQIWDVSPSYHKTQKIKIL